MRMAFGLLVVILVGGVGGAYLAQLQVGSRAPLLSATAARAPGPRVDIDQVYFDFGKQDLMATGTHEFVIRNKGTQTLQLSQGDTSCKCTVSKIPEPKVAPGQQTTVQLEWRGEQVGPYEQTATINTNDPGRPQVILMVRGEITSAARAIPSRLILDDVTASEGTDATVAVYGYLDRPLEVARATLASPDDAEALTLSVRPLSAEELAREPDARSGQAVVVTVKPGLPRPAIQQTIRLKTNYPECPIVEVPVHVSLASDMIVVGRGWDSDGGQLNVGAVSRRQGETRTVRIVVRGQARQQVRFKVSEVVPEFVRVTIGEPVSINDGAVFHTPLTIEIPPESRLCSYLGFDREEMGRIVLETTHPTIDTFELPLRFVVEDSD